MPFNRRQLLKSVGISILAALPLMGCQTLRDLLGFSMQKPRVSVLSLGVKKVTLTELQLLVELKVDNPNDIDLDFESIRYNIALDSAPLASGEFKTPVKLKAESSQKISLPLKIATQSALDLVRSVLMKPTEDTKVHFAANVVFLSPLGPINLDFAESRQLFK